MAAEADAAGVGRLDGRVALITGGGSGLGRAAAQTLAERGARIVACDLDAGAAAATVAALAGDGHSTLSGDVSDEATVDGIIADIERTIGRLDIVVNSAGIGEGAGWTLERTPSAWRKVIDVNLTGTYLVSRAAARLMLPARRGVVLTISSIAGVIGLPRRAAYSASKGAVTMLTRVLASEWAPFGVRVNAVAPGYIRTPLTDSLIAKGLVDEAAILRRTPAGVMGTPQQVADALAFLASDQAGFITGAVLPVDGGYLAYGAPEDVAGSADA